uniref:Uncharacterized protein n=1 Tax=Kalanchoe fedtschenkoi TaxID=63787 RepID=A0A7N0UMS2_KALFE
MDMFRSIAEGTLRAGLLEDQQQQEESGPVGAEPNPEKPTKTPGQRVIRRTFKNAANLAKLLPTGTVLLFQYLSPILTNEGKCPTPRNRSFTLGLLALCSLSCMILSFTDSVRDPRGKVRYGLATFRGLWIIDGSIELPPDEAAKYRVTFLDFFHSVLTVLVFSAVALFDQNVVKCFYNVSPEDATEWLIGFPTAIGLACSVLFVLFPSRRHGIGFPLSRQ